MTSDPALLGRLRQVPGFEALPAEVLRELAAGLALRSLAAGETLLQEGESSDGVFVLLAGRLVVTRGGRTLCTLEAGSVVGELAVITGELRAADVCAEISSELVMLAGEEFRRLVEAHPDAFAEVVERARRARRENQIAANLAALFGELDRETLLDLESEVDWLTLRSGELLFREGDAADAAYLVTSGRLRAVKATPKGERVLSEMGRGETVGEMALLTRDVRAASVFAVRDSQLLRMAESGFEKLIERRPAALRTIAGFVISRLHEQTSGHPRVSGSASAIAVVPASRGVDTQEICRQLAASLAELGRVTHLDRERVDASLARRGAADADGADPIVPRLSQWLDEREAASDWLLFEGDAGFERWTARAVRQADHVLIVARAEDGPGLGEVEARLRDVWSSGRGPTRSLVLQWGAGVEPEGTGKWLDLRPAIARHFHVRAGRPGDVARLARRVAGRSIGLVLGGGGARSFAHLGVLRVLEETGVPIDAYGGTSMGSIVAATAAMEVDAATAQVLGKQHLAALFDPTLPLVSLLAGRRIGREINTVFGARAIEDMPIPFYCIATDLSAAEQRVQTRGSLATALRASISLPGILPPVVSGERLLVDGGLLNNVPVDVMTELLGGGRVLAVDVSPDQDLAATAELPHAISGWTLLWRMIRPFGREAIPISVLHVLARSGVVASIVADREQRSHDSVSLYLKVPVAEWGMLDFKALEAISARGYESSRDAVARWWNSQRQATRL